MAFLIPKVIGKDQELFEAARTDNPAAIEKLLSKENKGRISQYFRTANVNCVDKNGYTPLHIACLNGLSKNVDVLLKNDAEGDVTDSNGCTPLHLAAWKGSAEICGALLSKTLVSVNQQDGSGETALHSAAHYGHHEVVDVLIKHKANPNIRNLKEESPLDLAAQFGHLEVVKQLLTFDPNLTERPLCNHSPLHLASRNGHMEIVEYLLDCGFNLHTMTKEGTALHEAALCGKIDVVRLLLEKGINVDEKNSKGQTALDSIDAHKSKQKSFQLIVQAITEHMAAKQREQDAKVMEDQGKGLDQNTYDSIAPNASPKTSPSKPKPKPRVSLSRSPPLSPAGSLDDPPSEPGTNTLSSMYSKVNKTKASSEDIVQESRESVPKDNEPPPVPPRSSVFPTVEDHQVPPPPPCQEENVAVNLQDSGPAVPQGYIAMDSAPPDRVTKLSPVAPPRRTGSIPKKPPRTKNVSPAPVRRGSPASTADDKPKDETDSSISKRGTYIVPSKDPPPQPPPKPTKEETSPPPALPPKTAAPRGDNTSEDEVEQLQDYMEMGSVPNKSETRETTKPPTAGEDQYGILYPITKRESTEQRNSLSRKSENSALVKSSSVEKDKKGAPAGGAYSENIYVSPSSAIEDSVTTESADQCEKDVKAESGGTSPKPSQLNFTAKKKSHLDSAIPLTPTGYPQPPTPDFPPPSPATAQMGIEQKIQQIETQRSSDKRNSRDMTTLTDDSITADFESLDQIQEQGTILEVTSDSKSGDGDTRKDVTGEVKSFHENVPGGRHSGLSVIKEDKVAVIHKTESPKHIPMSSIPSESVVSDSSLTVSTDSKSRDQGEKSDKSGDQFVESAKSRDQLSGDKTEKQSGKENIRDSIKEEKGEKSVEVTTESDKMGDHGTAEVEKRKGNEHEDGEEEVVLRRKPSSKLEGELQVFAGLLRGSQPGGPRKVVSQIIENVAFKQQQAKEKRRSVPSSYVTFDPVMEKEEEIDVDKVMESIEVISQNANRSSRGSQLQEQGSFNEGTEWDEINSIMASFGSGIARESVFIREFESNFTKKLISDVIKSIGEWLETMGLERYENNLVANGFDDMDFLGGNIMEEADLEQIGVLEYDHRQSILEAAKLLPQITPVDFINPPASVDEWLSSLHLQDYYSDTFKSHGYKTMEQVKNILWDLELRNVLDISMIGHRKRILASLGERQPPDIPNGSFRKKSQESSDAEETKSPFGEMHNVNLFRDYTKVKPVSSSEEDITHSPQALDSSEDEEVFKKEGKLIHNKQIHLRPPHLAQTQSPVRSWRHKPEMLIKGCCNYTAHYLGSTLVTELQGTESTRAGITKMKKSTDVLAKVPTIMLSISFKGVKFIDAKTKKVICDHEIGNIFCACQDGDNLNFFAYITRDIETGHHYCHVFSVKSSSLAHEIILTLGEAFEVAYQMALKDKSLEEAMALDRTISHSDHDDTASVTSKTSTHTV